MKLAFLRFLLAANPDARLYTLGDLAAAHDALGPRLWHRLVWAADLPAAVSAAPAPKEVTR